MDRRHVLLSLAGGLAFTPAFAQTAAHPMGEAEKKHAMDTAMAGMASLQMADIGLDKASNAMVKMFAKFEHDEQTTIAEILKSMDPAMSVPKPDAKTADTIAKLKGMSAGPDFDRMFVTGQIDGHEKLLDIQEAYLKSGRDKDTINVTKLARGMIKEHLALLGELKKTLA